jgi:hypothetical protein
MEEGQRARRQNNPALSETAALKCPFCGVIHSDEARQRMALSGRFIATNPSIKNRAGFRANGLIAVTKPKRGYVTLLHQFSDEYLRAVRRGTYFVRSFQNSVLAEAYEVKAEVPVETNVLCERRTHFPEINGEIIIPAGALTPYNRRRLSTGSHRGRAPGDRH